jgi:type IV pilus assembly protein PilV
MTPHWLLARKRMPHALAQRGFSMMEALVSAIVFALGAIGVAGMQTLSMQSNHEAMQRTQATFLATDIIERMQNNATALNSYDTDADQYWTILGGATRQQEPTPNCGESRCSPAQLASHDLWAWEQTIDGAAISQPEIGRVGGFQDPTGCIRHTGNGEIELAIAWRGRGEMSNSSVAAGCTVEKRYGDADRYRRVLLFRTYITR